MTGRESLLPLRNPNGYLTQQQADLLVALYSDGRNPGWTAGALGVRLGRPTIAVRRSLARLADRGLVWQMGFDDWRITNPGVGALPRRAEMSTTLRVRRPLEPMRSL